MNKLFRFTLKYTLGLQLKRITFAVILFFFLNGCVTPDYKSFQTIKIGDQKYDVIEAMGSPKRSRRIDSLDRWTYVFQDQAGSWTEKEVHFDKGGAVYIGPPVPINKISAEEQDALNEKSNQELADQEQETQSATQTERKEALSKYEAEMDAAKAKRKSSFVPVK